MITKIESYPVKDIPIPNSLPCEDTKDEFFSLSKYQNGVANRYAFELDTGNNFREYSKLIKVPAKEEVINLILESANNSNVELGNPQYIYTWRDNVCFVFLNAILLNPVNKCTTVQAKYYLYFKNRYPDSRLYSKGNNTDRIFVKDNGKVVGGYMPFSTRIDVYV